MKKEKKKVNYVDKLEFLEEMKDYKKRYNEAVEGNLPLPQVSDKIGDKIIKIATRLSYSPNFINYAFREEMIGDAIENCLMYIHNFDPTYVSEKNKTKVPDPFAYFTQISFWAFVRRIKREKQQFRIKAKYVQQLGLDPNLQDTSELQEHDSTGEFGNNYIKFLKDFYDFDLDVSEKKKK